MGGLLGREGFLEEAHRRDRTGLCLLPGPGAALGWLLFRPARRPPEASARPFSWVSAAGGCQRWDEGQPAAWALQPGPHLGALPLFLPSAPAPTEPHRHLTLRVSETAPRPPAPDPRALPTQAMVGTSTHASHI